MEGDAVPCTQDTPLVSSLSSGVLDTRQDVLPLNPLPRDNAAVRELG